MLADLYRNAMTSHLATRKRQRGAAFIEFLILFPMLFFLFAGVFDMGSFCYALIETEDAARIGALYTSSQSTFAGSSSGACQYVKVELSTMPNSSQFPAGCGSSPLQVTAQSTTGPDGLPASTVTVSYRTVQMPVLPIPGFARQVTITRTVQMKVRT
jgi:Flp pilus assembly protein TadG